MPDLEFLPDWYLRLQRRKYWVRFVCASAAAALIIGMALYLGRY